MLLVLQFGISSGINSERSWPMNACLIGSTACDAFAPEVWWRVSFASIRSHDQVGEPTNARHFNDDFFARA